MISYLSGKPRIYGEMLTVLVNGVGYQVHVGNNIKSSIHTKEKIELFVYTHVREDRLELYGFENLESRKLFMMFLDVSGVGPQTALSITDQKPSQIIQAVQQANTAFFTAIPRIGKKLAQKIIIDLRGKLGELKSLDLAPETIQEQQVKEALLALGFSQQSIDQSLEKIDVNTIPLETAIKQAIKNAGKTNT